MNSFSRATYAEFLKNIRNWAKASRLEFRQSQVPKVTQDVGSGAMV